MEEQITAYVECLRRAAAALLGTDEQGRIKIRPWRIEGDLDHQENPFLIEYQEIR